VRLAVQVDQDQEVAVGVREPGDLLVQGQAKFIGDQAAGRVDRIGFRFLQRKCSIRGSGLQRDPQGHPVEPTGQGGRAVDGPSFPGENEERILECVLGEVIVPKDPAADAVDSRTMTADQVRKCDLIARLNEPV
jgi:hypothetical protein